MKESLSALGFELAPVTPKARLIIALQGEEGTGKNHFAFTAPGPIGVQSTDIGTEGMVEKFRKEGKEIYLKHYKMPRTIGDLREDVNVNRTVDEAKAFLEEWEQDYTTLLEAGMRTIVWDTASELWEKLRWARGGRMEKIPPLWYAKFNEEFMNLVKMAYNSESNLILIHKVKDQWEGDQRTGRKERQGMSQTGNLVQVELTTLRDREAGFEFYFDKCRSNAALQDTVIPAVTFQELALLVYPETDSASWE